MRLHGITDAGLRRIAGITADQAAQLALEWHIGRGNDDSNFHWALNAIFQEYGIPVKEFNRKAYGLLKAHREEAAARDRDLWQDYDYREEEKWRTEQEDWVDYEEPEDE